MHSANVLPICRHQRRTRHRAISFCFSFLLRNKKEKDWKGRKEEKKKRKEKENTKGGYPRPEESRKQEAICAVASQTLS